MQTPYIVTEKQNLQSCRIGEKMRAMSLNDAMRIANAMQQFQGTVMTIDSEFGTPLASKSAGERWTLIFE